MIRVLLFLVATAIFIVLFPIAIIYKMLDSATEILFRLAISIDTAGNVLAEELFNDFFRKKDGYLFGNRKETISSALGKNQRDGTLRTAGWILVYILWAIDYQYWFKGGHCINSIDENV